MVNDDGSDLDIMFIHASFYKADPWTLYHENRFIGPNGEQVRGFRKPHRYGMDFELFLFNDMRGPSVPLRKAKLLNSSILPIKLIPQNGMQCVSI